MCRILTTDVPHNAKVTLKNKHAGSGFLMRQLEPWLKDSIDQAGKAFYEQTTSLYGEGGSIPFLNELACKYPETQIVALGVGGPYSQAHGPNEFLELDYCRKLTCCLSTILEDCGRAE
jgi:acetylornithine deacetylase/succinyl-diaminopimelate desuccinylase-like protein